MEGSPIRDRVLGGRLNISQQLQTTAADSTNSRRRAPSAKPPSGVSASAPNVAQPSQGEAGGTAAHRYYTPTGEGRGGDNPAQNDVGTDDELRTFNGQDLGGSGGIYRLPSLGDNTNPPTPTQRRSIPINNTTPTATTIRDTSPIPRAPQSRNVSVMLGSEHLSVRSNSLMDEQISPRLPTLSDRINNRSGSRHNNTTAASNTAIPTYETHEALVMMWMYTGLMKNRTIDEAFVPKDAGSWRPRKLSVTLENKGNAKGEVIKTGTIKIQKFDNKHSIRLEDQIHLLKAVTRFVIPKSHPVPFPTNPEGNEVTDFENFHDDNEDQNNGSFGPNGALHHSFSRSFGHGQMLMNREQSVDGFDPRSSNYTEQVPYFMRNGTAAGSFAFGEGASADGSSSNVPVYSKKHDVEINRRFTCGNIGLRIVSSTGKVYLMAMQNCPEVDSWLETLREVIQVHERDATFEEPAPNTLIASQSLLARPDCGQYKRDFLAIDLSKKDRSGKGSTKITVDEPPNHGNLMMLSDGAKKKKQQRHLTIQRPYTSLDSLIASADQVGERAGANRLDYSKRPMYPPSHGTYRPNAFGRSQDVVISMSGDGTTGSKSRGGLINHHSDVFDGDTSGRLLHLTSNAGLTTLRCPRRAGGGNDDSLALSDVCSNPPQLGESDDHGSTMGSLDASARRYDPSRIYDGNDPEIASIGSTHSRAHANVDADGLPNESFITNALNFSYEYLNSPAPRPFQREGDIDPLEERSPKADSATRYLSTIHRKRAEMLNKNQRDSERAIMFCAICGANKKEVAKCPVTNRKHVTQIITERERQREVARRHLIL